MQKENATENDESKELPVDLPPEEEKGLSLRDALEVAVEGTKEPAKDEVPKPEQDKQETTEKRGSDNAAVDGHLTQQATQPPAEWNAEEKADFLASTPKAQEAALRLHNRRQSKIEEIKREASDLQWAKDLAKEVEPYLKSVGGKKKAHEALIDALRLRHEFDTGNPKANALAYLKTKGIDPAKLLEIDGKESTSDEKITPLQKDISDIKMRIAQEDHSRATQILSSAWGEFEGAKNAGGNARYPDVGNSEAGLKLSANIGSLVRGDTELSKQFIANAKNRIPDLTYQSLLHEAYRYCGGKVDDSEAPTKTQSTQSQIAKSSRAAASRPGSGAQTAGGKVKKFKTYREAASAAMAELQEAEDS